MSWDNLWLHVASYARQSVAADDFQDLRDADASDDFRLVGAVLISRAADGSVTLRQHGGFGAVGALVVGLFAPPLLAGSRVAEALGEDFASLVSRYEDKQLGVDLEEWLPAGATAVAVVVEDTCMRRLHRVLRKASKRTDMAIRVADVVALTTALADAGYDVRRALAR